MNRYSLIAGGLALDTNEDLSVSLNYQIDDIIHPEKRNTSYSKTIILPGTPKNNKFFKHIYEVNVDTENFNLTKRIPVVIRIGDNDVLRGSMQLRKIINDNKQIEYDVVVYGQLNDIMTKFGDYEMRDLDLSEYNHVRNRQNILASWDYIVQRFSSPFFNNGPGVGYVYPHIITGSDTDITNTSYIYNMYPAVYAKTIIDKMFEFTNFTYTSEFFNSEYFSKLIVPFTDDKIQLSKEQVDLQTTRVGVPGNSQAFQELMGLRARGSGWWKNYIENSSIMPLFEESGTVDDSGTELTFQDPLNSWNNTIAGRYVCQEAGYYNISFSGQLFARVVHDNNKPDMEFKEGEFEYFYRLRKNATILDQSDDGTGFLVQKFGLSDGTHPSPWIDTDTPLAFGPSADDVYLDVGDVVTVEYGFNYPSSVKWIGTSDNKHKVQLILRRVFDGQFTKLIVEPSSNQDMGNKLINMNEVLPDKLKMKDFFIDILRMFNLIVQDNPRKDNDLIIEPRDDFFASRQRVSDWTFKLDNDSDVKIQPMSELDATAYLYTYTKDDDLYNKEYNEETKKIYGDLLIDVQNDFSDKTNKTTLRFAPTPNAEKYIEGRVAPFFVEKDDENFKAKKVKPRILFYGGRIPVPAGSFFRVQDFPGGANNVVYDYPYCGMWDHPFEPNYDLAFGWTEKIYWNSSAFPANNLYEMYHRSTMNDIIDNNARLMEAKFHLTPKDIADFDFRDIIFIKDSYWRVSKIKDYNPAGADSLTRVILYKLNNLTIVDKNRIEIPTSNTHCPNDVVAVVPPKLGRRGVYYKSVSGQIITEDCCRQMGGIFVNGICKARVSNIELEYAQDEKKQYNGGLGVVPISDPGGPLIFTKDLNTSQTLGIKIAGKNNYIPSGEEGVRLVIGDGNSVQAGTKGSIIIGDNINAIDDNTLYLGNIKLDGNTGNITSVGINIIDGGEDTVFPFDKTNFIDVVDGTVDSVRNPGGDSKARPIIDGNPPDDPDTF